MSIHTCPGWASDACQVLKDPGLEGTEEGLCSSPCTQTPWRALSHILCLQKNPINTVCRKLFIRYKLHAFPVFSCSFCAGKDSYFVCKPLYMNNPASGSRRARTLPVFLNVVVDLLGFVFVFNRSMYK